MPSTLMADGTQAFCFSYLQLCALHCSRGSVFYTHLTPITVHNAIHSVSEEPRGPQPAQKDTVMRNPPKRNMKTKSAVLPRKEPSSSMRQYLYLRAGEKGGVAV